MPGTKIFFIPVALLLFLLGAASHTAKTAAAAAAGPTDDGVTALQQDGLSYSGLVANATPIDSGALKLTGIDVKARLSGTGCRPALGVPTIDTTGFFGAVFDANRNEVLLLPRMFNCLVAVNVDTLQIRRVAMMSHSQEQLSPRGTVRGVFYGGVFDGRTVWMTPMKRPNVYGVDVYSSSPAFAEYPMWSSGQMYGFAFVSATFDGRFVWYAPCEAPYIVRWDTIDRASHLFSVPAPAKVTTPTRKFFGIVFDRRREVLYLMGGNGVLRFGWPDGAKPLLLRLKRTDGSGGGDVGALYYGCLANGGDTLWTVAGSTDLGVQVLNLTDVERVVTDARAVAPTATEVDYEPRNVPYARHATTDTLGLVYDGRFLWLPPAQATFPIMRIDTHAATLEGAAVEIQPLRPAVTLTRQLPNGAPRPFADGGGSDLVGGVYAAGRVWLSPNRGDAVFVAAATQDDVTGNASGALLRVAAQDGGGGYSARVITTVTAEANISQPLPVTVEPSSDQLQQHESGTSLLRVVVHRGAAVHSNQPVAYTGSCADGVGGIWLAPLASSSSSSSYRLKRIDVETGAIDSYEMTTPQSAAPPPSTSPQLAEGGLVCSNDGGEESAMTIRVTPVPTAAFPMVASITFTTATAAGASQERAVYDQEILVSSLPPGGGINGTGGSSRFRGGVWVPSTTSRTTTKGSLWFCPTSSSGSLLVVDLAANGTARARALAIPVRTLGLFDDDGDFTFSGCVFDGATVWLTPSTPGRAIVRVGTVTEHFVAVRLWPSAALGEAAALSMSVRGATCDGHRLWLVAASTSSSSSPVGNYSTVVPRTVLFQVTLDTMEITSMPLQSSVPPALAASGITFDGASTLSACLSSTTNTSAVKLLAVVNVSDGPLLGGDKDSGGSRLLQMRTFDLAELAGGDELDSDEAWRSGLQATAAMNRTMTWASHTWDGRRLWLVPAVAGLPVLEITTGAPRGKSETATASMPRSVSLARTPSTAASSTPRRTETPRPGDFTPSRHPSSTRTKRAIQPPVVTSRSASVTQQQQQYRPADSSVTTTPSLGNGDADAFSGDGDDDTAAVVVTAVARVSVTAAALALMNPSVASQPARVAAAALLARCGEPLEEPNPVEHPLSVITLFRLNVRTTTSGAEDDAAASELATATVWTALLLVALVSVGAVAARASVRGGSPSPPGWHPHAITAAAVAVAYFAPTIASTAGVLVVRSVFGFSVLFAVAATAPTCLVVWLNVRAMAAAREANSPDGRLLVPGLQVILAGVNETGGGDRTNTSNGHSTDDDAARQDAASSAEKLSSTSSSSTRLWSLAALFVVIDCCVAVTFAALAGAVPPPGSERRLCRIPGALAVLVAAFYAAYMAYVRPLTEVVERWFAIGAAMLQLLLAVVSLAAVWPEEGNAQMRDLVDPLGVAMMAIFFVGSVAIALRSIQLGMVRRRHQLLQRRGGLDDGNASPHEAPLLDMPVVSTTTAAAATNGAVGSPSQQQSPRLSTRPTAVAVSVDRQNNAGGGSTRHITSSAVRQNPLRHQARSE